MYIDPFAVGLVVGSCSALVGAVAAMVVIGAAYNARKAKREQDREEGGLCRACGKNPVWTDGECVDCAH